jgi:hypothetical protein
MKPKSIVLTLAGCAVLAGAAFIPLESVGQAPVDQVPAGAAPAAPASQPNPDEARIQQLLEEIAGQQKALADNQTKLDEKVAAVAEEVRVARIFAGRAGKR